MRGIVRLFVLASLASTLSVSVGTNAAKAGDIDCATSVGSCGFGAQVGGPLLTTLSTAQWTFNLTSTVYLNAGIYTYVYNTVLQPGSVQMDTMTTSSNGADLFSSALNWGVITGDTSAGVTDCADTAGAGCPLGATNGFAFGPNSFITNLSGFGPTGAGTLTYEFYVQSKLAPGLGSFSGQNGGTATSNTSLDPVPVPEPATLLLFGSGLVGIAGWVRRRSKSAKS